MTDHQVEQYLLYLDRLLHIYSHSGIDWRPEYNAEIQKIESDLVSLRESAQKNSGNYCQPPDASPEMISINEAAKRTGLSYSNIRQLLRDQKIPYIKSGNKFLLNYDALKIYLAKGEYEEVKKDDKI